jgi:NADH:ubiquinone oxidoreductase subunit 6 (subunit J)
LSGVLGLAGVYFLLPQPRVSRPVFGALLGVLAAILVGWVLIHNEAPLGETILFYCFSAMAIAGGGMMLSQRNPVHAALAFAVVIVSTCGLFLLLAAPFLMAATVIVYAGAIIVTFLFVIMLAQQSGMGSGADQRSREPFLACLAGFALMGTLLYVLEKNYNTRDIDQVLVKIRQVMRANSVDEMKAALADTSGPATTRGPATKRVPALVETIQRTLPEFPREKLDDMVLAWQQKGDMKQVKTVFGEVYERAIRLRHMRGSLPVPAGITLSPFSGTPPNVITAAGAHLPAANVAGLGRSLFTDYLLPVELAGTLLLVASIGAIVIAGRRTEGLR